MIRSGEAQLVGWSRSILYSGFNILPRSVIRLANSIVRSDNLDVITLALNPTDRTMKFQIRTLLLATLAAAAVVLTFNRDSDLEVARAWSPIWVSHSTNLQEQLKPLLNRGFVLQADATPGSPEEAVFNSCIRHTEPDEVILVSVTGDQFVAFTAAVVDHEMSHMPGANIETPILGGLYFDSGAVP